MKSKVRVKKRPDTAIKEMRKIAKQVSGPGTVKVGLPKDSAAYPDGTSVIMVGSVHEFGSPARGIPQRSFLRSTLTTNRNKYRALIKKLAKKIAAGDMEAINALRTLGMVVSSDVKQKITAIKSPPLQYREGNPLIDTGHLRQQITYAVEE